MKTQNSNEAPRAYARGIFKFFGERNPPKHYPTSLKLRGVSAMSYLSLIKSGSSAKADKYLQPLLTFILVVLFSLLCFSVFKNIQYPLLWNDEADTAMYAKRILQFGYPKVHDGKNTPIQAPPAQKDLVVDKKTDALLESDWLQYYFSAPFVLFAKKINDLYSQTAMIRIPFALAGLSGLLILALSVISAFKNNPAKLIFLSFFAAIELISIPLALHLREMRYYPLLLFLFACLFYIFFRYHIFNNLSYKRYFLLLVFLSLLILNTFHPAFFPLMIFLLLNVIKPLFSEGKIHIRKLSGVKKLIYPLVTILTLSIPYFLFFKTFSIAFAMSKTFNVNLFYYLEQLTKIIKFFWQYDLLFSLLGIKLILFFFEAYSSKKNYPPDIKQKLTISNNLSMFFLIYSFFIARIPYYLFTRYFIILQPIVTTIVILDAFVLFKLLSGKYSNKISAVLLSSIIIFNLFIFNGVQKFNNLNGHIYELTHRYEGPLDLIIPYIKSIYKNPDKLVIATNYEEYSYMLYLGSKITIGFRGINLAEDLKIQPDIIIYRNGWESNPQVFNYFLQKEKYKTVSFPIANYPVNNIPEFNFSFPHLFKTLMALSPDQQLEIFVQEDNNISNSSKP